MTFRSAAVTGCTFFQAGEKATITKADGGYVFAQTKDGRKIQTWASTFEEYSTASV